MKKLLAVVVGLLFFGMIVLFLRPKQEAPAAATFPTQISSVEKKQLAPRAFSPEAAQREAIPEVTDLVPLSEIPHNALPGEMTFTFASQQEAEFAVEALREAGIQVTDYNRALKSLRVRVRGASTESRLARLIGDNAIPGFTFPITIPPPNLKTGGGSVPFEGKAVDWMGGGKDPKLGQGITVAIIDTGISEHSNLGDAVVGEVVLGNAQGTNGHGTAIASLIVGQDEQAPGIAPGAEILSLKVLDAEGGSDSFAVAEAIVEATDAGAQVINLSLGTYGDAAVLQAAVDYALEGGAIIVAAVGNDAAGEVMYPAAYEGVIGVGSVDAAGQSATFSNFGEGLDISAPGVGIYTAYASEETPDAYMSFSGTSASAPLVSGSLAALLSQNPDMSTQQAVDILLSNANDSGAPGTDPHLGAGSANLERMLSANQSGIIDLAIADHYLTEGNAEAASVLVTVQNRGTEWVQNMQLNIAYEGREQSYYLGGLNPGQTISQEILLNPSLLQTQGGTTVLSRVSTSQEDARPDDNSRATKITLKQPDE